jgi:cell division protein FtsN
MSRKQPMRHSRAMLHSRHATRGGTLLGIFIGLVLGLSIAAAVAFFVGRIGLTSPLQAPGAAKEPARNAKTDLGGQGTTPDKPRFDFYKILPGAEEPKSSVDRRAADKGAERPLDKVPDTGKGTGVTKPADRFWLQAGAFASASDAENMKARLALSGWEASVQAVSLPDKTVRYRVRLGPYDNTDELGRVKTELGSRGFDVAVIKNQ